MRIGLTYDLRDDYLAAGYGEEETAEFDRVDTIEGIEQAVAALGHQPVRIGHVRQLVDRLAQGDRWDLVFNIAEGLHGIARESQVPALLDAYEIPYTFSDPLMMAVCLHKGITKLMVRDAGVPTADYAVVETLADLEKVALPYPLFAKPVAEGTGKGVLPESRAESPADLRRVCQCLLERFRQPVLVETYLPGREFTVGVAGTGDDAKVLGGMEVLFTTKKADFYSYTTKRDYEDLVKYAPMAQAGALADELGRVSLAAWRALGCRDAGRIDFRLDQHGVPHFLEVNPLPGLNPVHSDLPILCRMSGIEYDQLIAAIVESASRRVAATGVAVGRARKAVDS